MFAKPAKPPCRLRYALPVTIRYYQSISRCLQIHPLADTGQACCIASPGAFNRSKMVQSRSMKPHLAAFTQREQAPNRGLLVPVCHPVCLIARVGKRLGSQAKASQKIQSHGLGRRSADYVQDPHLAGQLMVSCLRLVLSDRCTQGSHPPPGRKASCTALQTVVHKL